MQFLREKNFKQAIPSLKIKDGEKITHEKVKKIVKRAAHYLCALQASDGHWPAQNAGPLFYVQPLVKSKVYFNYLYQIQIKLKLEKLVKSFFSNYYSRAHKTV